MERERRHWPIAFAAVMIIAAASIVGCGVVGPGHDAANGHGETALERTAGTAPAEPGRTGTERSGSANQQDTELIDPKELACLNRGVDDTYPGDAWFVLAAGHAMPDDCGEARPAPAGNEEGQADREQAERSEAAGASDGSGQAAASAGQRTRVMLDVPQRVQETGYWCVPAALQMVLAYHGIDVSQSTLAARMNTKPDTGTVDVDLARVANAYLFGVEDADPSGAGYRVQAVTRGDTDPSVAATFAERVKADMASRDPVFATVDLHALYPQFGHISHAIVIIGYDADPGGAIVNYHFIDPYYRVQDVTYGGRKIAGAAEMVNAIVTNEEPAYVW